MPLTYFFPVELPGIEPAMKPRWSCENGGFGHAKRRNGTWENAKR